MREAGLSNRFCPSVSLSVTRKKLKSRHIDPHKPSKWSQTIANSKKLLYVYLTEVTSLRFAVFRLFPTFHNSHWLHLFVTSETHQEHTEAESDIFVRVSHSRSPARFAFVPARFAIDMIHLHAHASRLITFRVAIERHFRSDISVHVFRFDFSVSAWATWTDSYCLGQFDVLLLGTV